MPTPPKIALDASGHVEKAVKQGSGTQVQDATSPLSPISPWPPLPSPPRASTGSGKRRQSSSHARPRASSSVWANSTGVGLRGIWGGATDEAQRQVDPVARDDARDQDEDGDENGDGEGNEDEEFDDGSEAGSSKQDEETLPSAPEVYGALVALLTYIAFAVYLVWAFAPEGWLDQWGWTWYPDREWAIIVPCYLMVIVLLTYLSYAALTAWHTPSFDSLSLITDKYANIPPHKPGTVPYYHKYAAADAIPTAVDLPIDLVCRVLYPPRRRPDT